MWVVPQTKERSSVGCSTDYGKEFCGLFHRLGEGVLWVVPQTKERSSVGCSTD